MSSKQTTKATQREFGKLTPVNEQEKKQKRPREGSIAYLCRCGKKLIKHAWGRLGPKESQTQLCSVVFCVFLPFLFFAKTHWEKYSCGFCRGCFCGIYGSLSFLPPPFLVLDTNRKTTTFWGGGGCHDKMTHCENQFQTEDGSKPPDLAKARGSGDAKVKCRWVKKAA